jgi:hypothetical protein
LSIPAQIGIEEKIVDHDDVPVTRELDVEFGAVGTERNGMREGAQRVLRPERRATPVGDTERRHQKTAWKSRTEPEMLNSTTDFLFPLE